MKEVTVKTIKTFIASNDIPFIATQNKLCVPIIVRMCKKMAYGIKFDDIKVCGNLIIDGHHRYLSALIMNFDITRAESHTTSATQSIIWDKVEFEEKDWDTEAKITHLNELDAKYNGLEIEFVRQIISG